MKKILILLLLFPINILAYENDYFSIDISDKYNDVQIRDNIYIWNNKENNDLPNVIVTVTDNNEDNLIDISNYKEEDIKKYKKDLLNTLKYKTSEIELKPNLTKIEKKLVNNVDTIYYELNYNTNEYYEYDLYEYNYTFTTSKYIISLKYINSEDNNDEINNLVKTFAIKDSKLSNDSFIYNKRNQIILIGLFTALISYLISLLIFKKNKTTKKR